MEFLEIRGELLLALSNAIVDSDELHTFNRILSGLPQDMLILCTRTLTAEILTVMISIHKTLVAEIVEKIIQSIIAIPSQVLEGRQGLFHDYATNLQMNSLNVKEIFGRRFNPNMVLNAPIEWTAFGNWAADSSSLAIPGLSPSLFAFLYNRGYDFALASSLASLHGQMLKAAKILRWLPFCKPQRSTFSTMTKLLSYLENCNDEPDARFHTSVTKYYIKATI